MNAEQKELFRKAVLRVLDANRTRYGATLVQIGYHISVFGFSPANCGGAEKFHEALADQVQYLTDKQLVEEVKKPISAENRAWRITEAGIALVDSQS